MRLVFVDETGDQKFDDYLGLCVAWMDARSYPLLKTKALAILKKVGWDADTEFKGSFLFSASRGTTGVEVEQRVEAARRLLDLNSSSKRSRMRFAYGRMSSDDKGADYLTFLPELLALSRVLPKAPSGAGKKLISITCDERSDVSGAELHRQLRPVLNAKGYVILECVAQAGSAPDSIGLMFADLVGYLLGRIDTISNDLELFEGLDQDQLANNGKIRKLASSHDLISKIKKLDVFVRE